MKKNIIARIMIIALIMAVLTGCTGCGEKKDVSDKEETTAPVTEEKSENVMMMQPDGIEPDNTMQNKELSLEDKISSMEIIYRFGDKTETLTGETISGWLTTLPDGSLSVNEAPAREYVSGLSSKYDTFGRKRSFTTHDGRSITVSGGDYGYWMDKASTRQELISQILTGESAELTPVYYGTADNYGENDIGNTYVEINIGDQHLWVYKNGEQVNESDFVSGGLFKGNGTPEGTYAITYKERDSTLVGEGYQSSVKYWMPFNGNIGLHDASWRDAFGGHIYYMKGSHGCINLPTQKAAEIYDQVEKGEAVVVYGSITKEDAIPSLTMEEKAAAAQKGYIPLTEDVSAYLFKQQGFDSETAAALAKAQLSGVNADTPQQTETPQNSVETTDQQPMPQEEE